jgi:glycerol uptake facilitator-like aquaporin
MSWCSGGHINPVVSLAIAIVDDGFTLFDLAGYTISQLLGGIAGAAVLEVRVLARLVSSILSDTYVLACLRSTVQICLTPANLHM